MSFPADLALAFGVVFVAEFADKTQLALLAMSARGQALRIWAGAAVAFLILTVVAAAAGGLLHRLVPDLVLSLVAGVLFIGFGIWSLLRPGTEDEGSDTRRAGFLSAFALMLVAELGDKTQLAVAALAADSGAFWATAIGGTAALWATSALAVGAGDWMGRRVRRDLVERVAGWSFIGVGVLIVGLALFT